jgi:hypothetical protein
MTAQAANSTSAVIAGEMGRILATGPLAGDADFFAAGGDSIRVVELVDRVVERYRDAVDDADEMGSRLLLAVFDNASPEGLAAVVDARLR